MTATDPIPAWEQRFRAPRVSLPDWGRDAPERLLYVSNASGTFELYAWDRDAGTHRQVTDREHGTTDGELTPDGAEIWWFDDTGGDELGFWRRQLFGGGPDTDAAPGVPRAYSTGLALGEHLAVVGCATDEGVSVHVVDRGGAAETRVLYADSHDGNLGDLSRDETLVALEHSEHGDSRHMALRVVRVDGDRFGEVVGDLWDGAGLGLSVVGFSPVAGDPRLLALHEQGGRSEPLLWDAATGAVERLTIPLEGELYAGWLDDASALLVVAEARGRSTLHRYDLATGDLTLAPTDAGSIRGAGARPDGTIWLSWSNAAEPTTIRSSTGEVVLTPPGARPPGSVAVTDAFAGNVHALVARPPGEGPFPTVFIAHGGPTHHDSDAFAGDRAAYVDLGCLVVQVNYRGSTGYGAAWRDAIEGRPGLTELEDIAAVQQALVDEGLIDPTRCVLTGGSWGGYLTLLGLGTQPTLWTAGVAAVPVADYHAAYEDEMEPLKAFDRSLFGGTPEELPEVWKASDPMTYLELVSAPVLVLAGANDPRCPIRQIDNWLGAAERLGKDVEVYRFDAGHGSLVVDERVRQMAAELGFVARRLGLDPLPGT